MPKRDARPVGHPVWDQGDGICHYPDCGRRLSVYGGQVQHIRGSGGRPRGSGPREKPMPADEARLRVRTLTAELEQQRAVNEALLARIAELEIAAHPWVAVHAKLDALLARPSGATVITHRRQADGGVGGRKERRAAKAAA